MRQAIAPLFGLEPEQVRVISPFVGGGFGSKGTPHAPTSSSLGLAALAHLGRPVKLALTRQQMFALVGYRTPTIQRVRLGADPDRTSAGDQPPGPTSLPLKLKEFAEQTAVVTRMMYALAQPPAPRHRLAPLDVPVPSWMRAPGECPGMFGPEVAARRARRTAADLIRSNCGSATSPPSIPNRATVSTRRRRSAFARAPNSSAGRRAILSPVRTATAAGSPDTASPAATYPVNRIPGSAARIRFHPAMTPT